MSGTPRPDRGGGFGPVRIIANPAFFSIYSSNFKKNSQKFAYADTWL
jgi:hypothetical protein